MHRCVRCLLCSRCVKQMHFITQSLLYLVLCHARRPYDINRYRQGTPLYIVSIRYTPHYSLPASEQYYCLLY
jgi:hypothetical protein